MSASGPSALLVGVEQHAAQAPGVADAQVAAADEVEGEAVPGGHVPVAAVDQVVDRRRRVSTISRPVIPKRSPSTGPSPSSVSSSRSLPRRRAAVRVRPTRAACSVERSRPSFRYQASSACTVGDGAARGRPRRGAGRTRSRGSRAPRDDGSTSPPDPTYAFGDSDLAAERLRLLDATFRTTSRRFLVRDALHRPAVALDLGCGPGATTALLRETVRPGRTIGIDASPAFLDQARQAAPDVELLERDLTVDDLPAGRPRLRPVPPLPPARARGPGAGLAGRRCDRAGGSWSRRTPGCASTTPSSGATRTPSPS